MSDEKKPVVIDLLVYDTIAGHHWLSPAGKAVPKPKNQSVEALRYHARRRAQRAAEAKAKRER